MWIWSWKLVIVPTMARARLKVPCTSYFCRCAASGRADSLIPKVGHRGAFPSVRSKTSTGKFDNIPPSTMYETASVPSASRPVNWMGS